ncbi:hypothetical protein KPSA3_01189 [Pseudomonas syringae pv. actinidiae]|uniref:Uncharacterized protein n=1 Tax=Pseudomonas syringae pv. actinidiae TaxID=103796 RepID=A0AAN4Q1E7_PSESF|nr:hypothetical protein KPSA3_01189 [Pseudomonas syringae pv. actinidiae]
MKRIRPAARRPLWLCKQVSSTSSIIWRCYSCILSPASR